MVSYAVPYSKDMLELTTTPTISRSVTFTGSVTANIAQPSNECRIIGKESYASIELNIQMIREDGTIHCLEPIINAGSRVKPTTISIPHLCQNPAGALFQSVSCYVKGEQVSNYQYAPQVTTLYKMLYETKREQDSINCLSAIKPMNENDVKTALSDPTITLISFNAEPDTKAKAMIERSAVPIHMASFSIIYELTNFIKEALLAKVPKEYVEEVTGRAKIMAVFSKDKDKQVVGGKVEVGSIETGNGIRIMRREIEIGRGTIRELQQQKKKASEVREGYEFGTLIDAKMEIAPGDRIEAVKTVEKTV